MKYALNFTFLKGEYKCENSGICIGLDKICDGTVDCPDNAMGANFTALDEENCSVECAEGEIQCLHENDFPLPLKCIPEEEVAEKRCNGINDCGTVGANDEIQENGEACITTCADDEFKCSTDLPVECVSQVEYCKGMSSCSNGMEFFCPEEMISDYCNNGGAVYQYDSGTEYESNTEYDSDTEDDSGTQYDSDETFDVEFVCIDKNNRLEKCISQNEYCAGALNCTNDKEFLCPVESISDYCNQAEEFACVNENNRFLDVCIAKEKICDGNPDCPNGKDEEECNTFCQGDQLQCFHGENRNPLPLECISINQRCNGVNDCSDGQGGLHII